MFAVFLGIIALLIVGFAGGWLDQRHPIWKTALAIISGIGIAIAMITVWSQYETLALVGMFLAAAAISCVGFIFGLLLERKRSKQRQATESSNN